jgi:predicted TIM-barrel fold metal-dependent hydrolase
VRFATCFLSAVLVLSVGPSRLLAQEPEDIREMKLKDWAPKSMMVTKVTAVDRPMFPAIDVHNHLGGGAKTLTADRIRNYLTEMNEAGVRTVVNLDGGWGDRLKETLAALDEAHPERFLTFALIDFKGIGEEGWTDRETQRLEESFKAGAKGLKFHKSLGLGIRDKDGKLVAVDDPRLAPIFEVCGKHHRPVMIHTADPAAFFTPLDRYNERWHELNDHPDWLFFGDKYPPQEELLKQFVNVVAAHPKTTFIGAHFGNNVEDLATVGKWLDEYPNLYVDLDARISELGRQPYTAHKFFVKYQDRILFGTDTTPRREAFRIYYRFLETEDEYFDCRDSHHLQGFWMIYGINLPKEVLEKVYSKNAERILFPYNAGKAELTSVPEVERKSYRVKSTQDFELNGKGDAKAWESAEWQSLVGCGGAKHEKTARFKVLWSAKGLYVLMQGSDTKVTATMQADYGTLWTEDCFEVFVKPDPEAPLYFEYEISPLGYELPIMITNIDGKTMGWQPWLYGGGRKIRKAIAIEEGKQEPGAAIQGWSAEIFIPFELLKPLKNVPPEKGTTWTANFYRMDYDDGEKGWNWSPTTGSFHQFQKFGTLVFE